MSVHQDARGKDRTKNPNRQAIRRKSLIISVCIGDYFIKMLYEIIYCISECRQIILYNIPYQIGVDVKITMSGVRF